MKRSSQCSGAIRYRVVAYEQQKHSHQLSIGMPLSGWNPNAWGELSTMKVVRMSLPRMVKS